MLFCFKASETLLGIETSWRCCPKSIARPGFKASETLLGIETTKKQALN